jgi:hypothetical protein
LDSVELTTRISLLVWQWVVSNKHDLKLVIGFLDARMRSEKKIREYTLWKRRFRSYFENART